jgi:hypothetical protein
VSFWNLSDGESAITNEKEFAAANGDFDVIPKGTSVLVSVEDATWKAGYNIAEEFVNLKVRVTKPEAYANRVLFFKLWIDELDPSVKTNGAFDKTKALSKRDKHKKMLMAIDANGKGRLAKVAARPSDDQLAVALTSAQFVATLGVWDKTGDDGKKTPGGNWLMAARPKSSEVPEVAPPAPRKPAPVDDLDDDDVPF